jgi:hypothetical protein
MNPKAFLSLGATIQQDYEKMRQCPESKLIQTTEGRINTQAQADNRAAQIRKQHWQK